MKPITIEGSYYPRGRRYGSDGRWIPAIPFGKEVVLEESTGPFQTSSRYYKVYCDGKLIGMINRWERQENGQKVVDFAVVDDVAIYRLSCYRETRKGALTWIVTKAIEDGSISP